MSTKQIATSTLWQLGSQITMAALSIITVKFVAIALSKELAGNYNTAYGYLQLFGILADFGLYAVAVREVSRATDKHIVLGSLLVLRSIILVITLASALIIVWVNPHWQGTPLPLSVTIAAFVPFFTILAGTVRTAFQVFYKMQYVFAAEVSQRIITVSLFAIVILLGFRQTPDERVLYVLLAIGGVGAFILLLLSFFYANTLIPIRPNFDTEMMFHLLKQAMPFGLAFFFTALYRQSDVTLIAILRPQDFQMQNAMYGFVQRMMDMAYLLPTFLLNSTLPILAERTMKKEDTRDFLGKILLATLLLSIISFCFAFLWSRPLTQLLTTDQYLSSGTHPGSDTALHILSGSMALNGIVVFSFYCLLSMHRWKPFVTTLGLGVICALASNYVLIPMLGFTGAAYTSVFVHGFLALALFLLSSRALPARIPLHMLIRLGIFALALTGILTFLAPFLTQSIFTALALGLMTVVMIVLVKILKLDRAFLQT